MTPEEEAQLRQLGVALERVTRWESDVTGSMMAGGWEPAPGSELETDDNLVHPFTVSSAPWSAVTAGVSHLGALRDSLFRWTGPTNVQAQIHTHGQLSLVRGALENASLAYWLLEPDRSIERITRRIQEDWDEVRQIDTVKAEIGIPRPKTLADYEAELTAVLVRVNADPSDLKRRPKYNEIVKMVGATQPAGAQVAFVTWKACSSIAHGEFRGQLAYLKNKLAPSKTPGMQLSTVTGNIELLVTGSLIAIGTVEHAMRLYGKRSGTSIPI